MMVNRVFKEKVGAVVPYKGKRFLVVSVDEYRQESEISLILEGKDARAAMIEEINAIWLRYLKRLDAKLADFYEQSRTVPDKCKWCGAESTVCIGPISFYACGSGITRKRAWVQSPTCKKSA